MKIMCTAVKTINKSNDYTDLKSSSLQAHGTLRSLSLKLFYSQFCLDLVPMMTFLFIFVSICDIYESKQ